MIRSFSTVRDTQRGTQSYMEKRREEGDRGGQEDKSGNQKETDPASNQFPKCSPQSEHTERFTEFGREEKGEGGDRGDPVEKKQSPKRGESSQASNLAPK